MSLPKPYYEHAGITIYNADCREILPHLPPVDLVLTDPPYGIGIASNPVRQRYERKDWDDVVVSSDLLTVIRFYSKQQIIWGGNYFGLPASQCFLVWDKVQPEQFSLAMCEQAWTSFQKPAKLFRRHVVSFDKWHPTQKPVELMRWCVQQAGDDCGLILDPFMGSGTTLVAAKQLGRRCIGVEIEEKYCEIAAKRLGQEMLDFGPPTEAQAEQETLFGEATP